MTLFQFYLCFKGIVFRESLRFFYQRERFFSALVRPLVWLAIFAVGFRSFLGVSRPLGQPEEWPYPVSLIPYELYIVAGLIAMIQLFNGMQSSLSMVYDREMGSIFQCAGKMSHLQSVQSNSNNPQDKYFGA